MRVMYVISSMARGGAEMLLATQSPILIQLGVEPFIVTTRGPQTLIEQMKLPVRHFCLNMVDAGSGRRPGSIQLVRRLRRVIKAVRPDLVHFHLRAEDAWGRLSAAGLVPTLTTWHSTYRWLGERTWRSAARKKLTSASAQWQGTRFIAVSQAVRLWCAERLGINPGLVEVIYPGVEIDKFVRAPAVRLGSPLRLVMVGRFRLAKGHDVALKALKIVRDRGLVFRADFVGGGELLARTKMLAGQLGLANVLTFFGECTDVLRVLPQYDMFLMPSRWEGLPVSALEAMASYVPGVATRVSGLTEVYRDGVNGLLVPPEDSESLASAILRLGRNAELRRQLALAGRKIVEEEFDLVKQTAKVVAVYRELVR